MKDITKLIVELADMNINVYLEEEKLKIDYPDGVVLDTVIPRIKQHREELIAYLLSRREKNVQPIPLVPDAADYVLSSSQRRLWVLGQLEESNVAYNMPGVYVFEGELDVEALSAAFTALIARHEVLRTVFREDGRGEVRQVVRAASASGFRLIERDLRFATDQDSQLEQLLLAAESQGFDLSSGPLLRAELYHMSDNRWILSYVLHHIISDGWSMDILIRELLLYYNAARSGEPAALAPLRVQYKDYAAWQQQELSGLSQQGHGAYWQQHFSGELPVLSLTGDRTRPAMKTYNGGVVSRVLSIGLCAGLRQQGSDTGTTLFMVLLSGLNALLYRYTGQEDIIIGSSIAGREHPDLAGQIGFYINTLALRSRFSGSGSYASLLSHVREVTLGAYEHQHYPFDELVNALPLQRDLSRNPLFDVQIEVLEGFGGTDSAALSPEGLDIESYGSGEIHRSKFDLTFSFDASGDQIACHLVYNSDLYDRSTAERMLQHLERLLSSVVSNPSQALNKVDYLGDAERLLLHSFNEQPRTYYSGRNVAALFTEQAQQHPASVALIYEGNTYTYGELEEQSNRLAHYLREYYEVHSDDLVGILLDRSPWMVVAVLGVLKSGGAYVPIDPEYPSSRKSYILTDTNAPVLLTQTTYMFDVPDYVGAVFAMDVQLEGLDSPSTAVDVEVRADSLAYVIYTSGTTGLPKGCGVSHGSLANYVEWANQYYFKESVLPHFGLYTSLSFDLTVTSLYCPLTQGGTLTVFSATRDLQEVLTTMLSPSSGINSIKLTPSHVKLLPHLELSSSDITCAILGGEEVTLSDIRILKGLNPAMRIYNEYGPTEATVGCVVKELAEDETVLIGRPECGALIYVIDSNGSLCPVGVTGELYIAGPVLARGYLHQDALTAEKFIADPFRAGERMYRTGDTGRWLPNGELAYTGRIDDQVKVRGYRIEPGEVERSLLGYEGVTAAVVVAKKDSAGVYSLVAYVTGDSALALDALRAYLESHLPVYMVPSYYMQLEALPLTLNGKVNKKLLPDPEENGTHGGTTYVAPQTETEIKLAAIWEDILEKKRIGVKDDFFTMGGHSLKAIRLANEIHRVFGVRVTLKDLFNHLVLSSQALFIEQAKKTDVQAIPLVPDATDYVLSSSQRRLWILSQLEESNVAYNMPGVYVFEGELDVESLSAAFTALIARHEVLRTVFREDGQGEVRQVVREASASGFRLTERDLRFVADQDSQLEQLLSAAESRAFALSSGPLLRAELYRMSDNRWVLSYVLHHIISDGWSMNILIGELLSYYNAARSGEPADLAPLRVQYKDYAAWQRQELSGLSQQEHSAYWQQHFSGELPVLSLTGDRTRPAMKTYNGEAVSRVLAPGLSAGLRQQGSDTGSTLFMVLLSGLNALLYRYTGQEDIIIGSSIAGREHPDLAGQIGFYINTLALRSRFSGSGSYASLLSHVREVTLGAYEHQHYPFDELVNVLPLQRDLSRNPLFDVQIEVLEGFGGTDRAALSPEGLDIESYGSGEIHRSKFDLTFSFDTSGDQIACHLIYNSDLYNRNSAERMLQHLERLLSSVVSDPSQALNKVDYLGDAERLLLHSFNEQPRVYNSGRNVAALFTEQAQQHPASVALIYEGNTYTYGELEEQSNRLAHYLREYYEVRPDDLVGILLDRSPWMVIAVLGVLKSGGAYVPIDPEYPSSRKSYILTDTNAPVLLTQTSYMFDVPDYVGAVFAMDVQLEGLDSPATAVDVEVTADSLAYVIYTSGTTGLPKGCGVSHGSLANYVEWANQYYFKESVLPHFGLYTSLSFDLTVTSLYCPLTQGGTLTVFSTTRDLQEVLTTMLSPGSGINSIKLTPSHVKLLPHLELSSSDITCAILGGEEVTPSDIRILKGLNSSMRIYNEYGPTEATVGCVVKELAEDETVLIGRPECGALIYVLDSNGSLCPVGVTGELYIAGPVLARGYLHQDALTAEKFIADPFRAGERMYRTGDTGRWLPNGELAYTGRIDDQVKVRGYRIEPGEVERSLLGYEGVTAAVVVAKKDSAGVYSLVAYVTSHAALALDSLRAYLESHLPVYMVPSYYMQLEALPLTLNGKVNKKLLPDPEENGTNGGTTYVAPQTETEIKLAAIWEDILEKKRIGVKDDFFTMGGHSLKAIRLANEIHRVFGVRVTLKDLFNHLVLSSQALFIEQAKKTDVQAIPLVPDATDYVLSSSQRRLWILSQLEESNVAYNMPGVYVFEGELDVESLSAAFTALIARHEVLRTVFREDGQGEVRQVVREASASGFRLIERDLRFVADQDSQLEQLLSAAESRAFDLSSGPLLRAELYRMSDNRWVLSYVLHHIISDGWSMNILIGELLSYYNAARSGEPADLAPLRVQYKDYAAWQRQELSGLSQQEHGAYWQQHFSGELPVLSLAGDRTRPAMKTYNGEAVSRVLALGLSAGLRQQGSDTGSTLFMVLLSGLNALLYRYTGQEDIIIGSSIAGREHPDLAGQIGFYINTLALRSRFSGSGSYASLLSHVREVTLGAYEHQHYPFDELVNVLPLQRDLSRNPLFDVQIEVLEGFGGTDSAALSPEGLDIESYGSGEIRRSKFDLTFSFDTSGDQIACHLIYNSDLYNRSSAERMLQHLERLLSSVVSDPLRALNKVDYLGDAERLLLHSFNEQPRGYHSGRNVAALFTEQAHQHPASVALIYEGETYTYGELEEQSNRLAHYLREYYEVQPDDLVGILLDRSPWMVIAVLGVLKSGGAYVPIDPEYPSSRKSYILTDTNAPVLLTQTTYMFDVPEYVGAVFAMDVQLEGLDSPATAVDVEVTADSLAYVIYTSGTTGMPKGCGVSHGSLANYVEWANQYYFKESVLPHFGLYTSLSFDLTVTSLYCPLTQGGTLTVFSATRDLQEVLTTMLSPSSGINSIKLTPSHVKLLPHLELSSSDITCAILGGEEVTLSDIRILKGLNSSMRIYNEYGPTEATVGCVVKELAEDETVLIGRPECGALIYVLDSNGSLCPVGVTGELYIAGPVLARGYLHQEALTAEKFIADPFRAGERMYRTGDTGRWLPNGELAYTGRIDDQVKVRGYRIEPGEVERSLLGYEGVTAAVVVAKKDSAGVYSLVAYVTSHAALVLDRLRIYLESHLPAYMVPSYYIQLEALPLTLNGKVNKKLLPDPEEYGINTGTTYVAPRNEMEQQLVSIFEDVLNRREIGIKDDFFVLGGDSIKSIQIVSRLKKKGYTVTIQDVMKYPQIEQLAQQVTIAVRTVSQEPVTGLIPLSPIQSWFLNNPSQYQHHYNQSVLLQSRKPVSEVALRAVLAKVVLHHDALRMVYRHTADGWEQENLGAEQGYSLEVVTDADETSFREYCERIQSGFNLEKGPLLRACLFCGQEVDRLLLVVHHLVMDGVSWRILFEDLSTLLTQYDSGEPLQLPLKTDSFSYWQQQQLLYASGAALHQEAAYWSEVETHTVAPLQLDHASGANQVKDTETRSFTLDETMTERLLTKCYKAYRTEINDLLVTALSLSLSETLSLERIVLQLEGHGRENIGSDVDVSRTIGWFTTLYPVAIAVNSDRDMIRQLISVKENLHRVPNKGIGYGVLRYLSGKSYALSPEISFNYLGDFGGGVGTSEEPLFEFSGDYHGQTISPERQRDVILEISGMIAGGQLRIAIGFSRQQYDATTIETLLAGYRRHLEQLVNHLSEEVAEHTSPVDFTYKSLSMEQLQKLNQML
ncbi:non-ribosomal peptide synthetase [Chitinophaga flava]|uniref:Carrier domain-containing protein n=1 Tax=Chitinophaga flava TaxID=2259036 RepID=A0A365XVW1_9BACT|nr:non-ribosomal peptide synthetase [Chitinophaga flava]RBL90506.1 hypothetical protein DF182_29050 [Chitinophaga flava]